MSKTIVVLGATGNQGGSVASTFLQNPEWHVRAVTRNASGAKAAALRASGAEIVEADLDSPETLPAAFAGAHAIYAVSDPNALLMAGPEKSKVKPSPGQNLMAWATGIELQQLKSLIDAAAQVPTLERLVLSVLQDAGKWSGGKYTQVYHFESKAKAEQYIKDTYPALWEKTSSYVAGWFLTNILPNGLTPAEKSEDGTVKFSLGIKPTTRMPVFAAEEDSGPIVEALIKEPTAGKKVRGERASMTLTEFLDVFTKTTGSKAIHVERPADPTKLPVPPFLQGPISEMTAFWNEFGYEGGDASVISPQDLTYPPALETVEQYLQKKWE